MQLKLDMSLTPSMNLSGFPVQNEFSILFSHQKNGNSSTTGFITRVFCLKTSFPSIQNGFPPLIRIQTLQLLRTLKI